MASEDKVSICSKCKMQYFYEPGVIPNRDICGRCGEKLIHTSLTVEEMILIEHISEEREFINAMLDLRNKDIIEYKTKIAQYREQAKKDGYFDSKTTESNKPKCPTCGSANIKKISSTAKATNTVLFGIFGNKRKKQFHCESCGYEW